MEQTALSQRFTPTTTALLRWWFDRKDAGSACPLFQEEQRRSILRTISEHESPDGGAPWLRGGGIRRIALAAGADQIPVLLALLVWQVLNRNDASAVGIEDPRFTHRFVVVVPNLIARGRVYTALCGLLQPGERGERDFETADIVRLSPLLLPDNRRNEVLAFVRAHVCSGMRAVHASLGDRMIVITGDRIEALEDLARLPEALVFEDGSRLSELFSAPRDELEPTQAGWP